MPSDGDSSSWAFYEYLKLTAAGDIAAASEKFEGIKRYHAIDCQSVKKFYDWLALRG
jgi:hypothetical protein